MHIDGSNALVVSLRSARGNPDRLLRMAHVTQGQLSQAVEGLLNLEKSSRLAEDITATKACCAAILVVCYEARDWRALEENVMLLTKRRSQLKQVGMILPGYASGMGSLVGGLPHQTRGLHCYVPWPSPVSSYTQPNKCTCLLPPT